MATTAYLSPLILPSGTEYPGTMQQFLTVVAQYMQIKGLADLGGINFGNTTPSESDRDKPWFKTDGANNPIGWFSWNGSEWAQILFSAPYGGTSDRPSNPTVGQIFLDTDIDTLLIYERAAWRTVTGSPGDVKFVNKPTLAEALQVNPGWIEYTAAAKRVLAAADGTTGYDVEDTLGAAEVTLTVDQIPAHSHTIPQKLDPNGGDHNDSGSDTFINSGTGQTTDSTGGGEPHNNMQPTICLWCLIKS